MSTQRRENRWQCTGCTKRAAALEKSSPAPVVQQVRALAKVGTAPPPFGARLATISLYLDYRFVPVVRQDVRRGSPPFGAGRRTITSSPTTHGSSLRYIPSPSGIARLHLTLSQDPAG